MIELLSTNPARVLSVQGGTLAEGSVGDVTLFSLNRQLTINPARFQSKGRNTPFAGWKLRGRPVATIVGGRRIDLS
jgi:dihydroorotase